MNITEQTILNALLLQEQLLMEKNIERAKQKARAYFASVTGSPLDDLFMKQADYFDKAYELDVETSPRFILDKDSMPTIKYTFVNPIMDDPEVPAVLSVEELNYPELEWRQHLQGWVENALLRGLRGMKDSAEISLALADLVD